ncbi:hypothetical protein C8N25_12583 [Algoriphagus antarcticus]|uniref:Uncharacterized protein n=2 Tax=Algoriphagus TaxID=246875 RepID=A0A3E0DG85_9BACT|nr:hypothetical protein C8N25_12583 [Algoriphagus antarcticus]
MLWHNLWIGARAIISKLKSPNMNNLFKGLIAGYGAYKLGGGCLGTILVFVVIFLLLGQCS